VARAHVESHYIAEERAEYAGGFGVDCSRRRYVNGIVAESRHYEVLEQEPAVGMRIGAHAAIGTCCERNDPSVCFPSTNLGPVQPLGERSTIIGHGARRVKPCSRASCWMRSMSARTASMVAAISWCITCGSSPETKRGS